MMMIDGDDYDDDNDDDDDDDAGVVDEDGDGFRPLPCDHWRRGHSADGPGRAWGTWRAEGGVRAASGPTTPHRSG